MSKTTVRIDEKVKVLQGIHKVLYFYSYPSGFGHVGPKMYNRKALSPAIATKTRHSAHLSNGTDITTGMKPSMQEFIYVHHFSLIFFVIFKSFVLY